MSVHLVQSRKEMMGLASKTNILLRWGVYISLILAIIFLGHASAKFIYFQF